MIVILLKVIELILLILTFYTILCLGDDYHVIFFASLVLPDCYSMLLTTYWIIIWLIDDEMLISICLFDDLWLGFYYSNLTLETGGFQLTATITLELQTM